MCFYCVPQFLPWLTVSNLRSYSGLSVVGDAVVSNSGGAVVTFGGVVITSGDAVVTSGGAIVTSGDAVVTSGGAVVTSGGVVVSNCSGVGISYIIQKRSVLANSIAFNP